MAALMYPVDTPDLETPDLETRSFGSPSRSVRVLPVTHTAPRRPQVASRRSNRSAATYWRRRIVAVGIALCTVLMATRAGAALGGSPLNASGPRPHIVTHVVAPGDTLWKIAGELDPKADPRQIVDLLVEARHTTALTPGETIIWLDR